MKSIKKLLILFTVILMLLTVCACKNQTDAQADVSTDQETTAGLNDQGNESGNKNSQSDIIDQKEQNKDSDQQNGGEDNNDKKTSQPGDIVESIDLLNIEMTADELYDDADIIIVGKYDGKSFTVVPDQTKEENVIGTLFTDQVVSCERVIKGDAQGDIRVRRIGGKTDERNLSSNDPELQEGKQYLLFLTAGPSVVEGDTENYKIVGGLGIFPIDSDGNLDVSSQDEQDAQRLLEIYSQK